MCIFKHQLQNSEGANLIIIDLFEEMMRIIYIIKTVSKQFGNIKS